MTRNKRKFIFGIVVGILVASAIGSLSFNDTKNNKTNTPESQQQTKTDQSSTDNKSGFNKKQFSIDDPSSIWVVTNKKRPLGESFAPSDLTSINNADMRDAAAKAAIDLMQSAKNQGVNLKLISGYRSYQAQKYLYESYVTKDGQAAADTYSARPGFSEHQTGLAADLGNSNGSCDLEICFADTEGGKWLADHAKDFGFVIRYPADKTAITGYQYEPWHIRYVGKDLAAEINSKNQTLEEFFGLDPAPNY